MLYIKQKGSVNYTIVGSPTIVDGVASGFSANDYLSLTSTLTSFSEIVFSFVPGTYSSGRNVLFKTGTNAYRGAFQQVSDTQGQYFYTKTDNTAGNRYVPCTPGIVNIFKIQYISENSISCILSRQGYEDSTFDLTDVDIAATFGGDIYIGRGSTAYNPWNGTIDLNHTYIKVNGQAWFGICPIEVQKHQLKGPVGYTTTGNATVTDGILTGVDSSSSCYTTSQIPTFNELEMVFKAKRSPWTSATQILPICGFGTGSNSTRRITTNASSDVDGGTRLFYGSTIIANISNSLFDVMTYGPLWYYTRLKVKKNLSDYTYEIGVSADGISWITATGNYSDDVTSGSVYFLRNGSGSGQANGFIDLNATYIKVNGKLWFWQPRETERIVVNGVQVWQKPS